MTTELPEPRHETDSCREDAGCCDGASPSETGNWSSLKGARRIIWRVFVAVVGSALILAGGFLSIPFIPGPGVVVMLAGLAILATEFAFARRLLHRLRDKAKHGVSGIRDWWRHFRGKDQPPGNADPL